MSDLFDPVRPLFDPRSNSHTLDRSSAIAGCSTRATLGGYPYVYMDFTTPQRSVNRAPRTPDELGSNRSNNPYKHRVNPHDLCSTGSRTRVEQVEQPGRGEPYAEVFEVEAGPFPGLLALRPLTVRGGVLGPWSLTGRGGGR